MKEKIARGLCWLRAGFVDMLRLHPVETALAVYATAGCILTYELDWNHALAKLALVPIFFTLALVVNNLAGRGPWRRIYWVCWLPLVPLSCWSGLEAWLTTQPAFITYGVLLPLLLLLCRLAFANDRFVGDAIIWLRSGLLALLFGNVVLGLFAAIFFSTVYIFGLDGRWVEHVWVYALILCETFVVPVLFLMMSDRWAGGECRGQRVLEVLLNYVVTPALLIYAAIFYLYMARILVTWTLPEGGVAYLVFGFTLFALAVQAVQFLLRKRRYDWFFDRFSLLALPMQVLFWFGVLRRTGEYGLTEPRVYLLLCGGLMTLCVLMFLSRRTGRYYYVSLAALLCFAALAYVPPLMPERIAVRSQTRRVVRIARQLGRLDQTGRMILTPVPMADTVHWKAYHRLYESLRFLAGADGSEALETLGIERTEQYLDLFPVRFGRMVQAGYSIDCGIADSRLVSIDLPATFRIGVDGDYPILYTNLRSWGPERAYAYENDTLRLYLGQPEPVRVLPGAELLRRQLERSGYDPASGAYPTAEQTAALLDYRDPECRILFGELTLLPSEESDCRLEDVIVNQVMIR